MQRCDRGLRAVDTEDFEFASKIEVKCNMHIHMYTRQDDCTGNRITRAYVMRMQPSAEWCENAGLDESWTELNWTKLNWTKLNWTKLN